MNKSLLPWTRLVLVVSALVQGIFALIGLLAPDVMHGLLWPPPFQPVPVLWIRYDAVLYLAMSLGATYALFQNSWVAARAYLAIAGLYIAIGLILNILAVVVPPGAPPIVWVYLALSIIYLPLVFFVWRQQAARAALA